MTAWLDAVHLTLMKCFSVQNSLAFVLITH